MVGESITCSDTEHTSAGRREAKLPRLSRVAHLHGRIVLIQKLAVLPDKPLVFKCEVFAVGAVHTSPLNAVTQIWQKRVRDARGIQAVGPARPRGLSELSWPPSCFGSTLF